jgi:hypothetical protein
MFTKVLSINDMSFFFFWNAWCGGEKTKKRKRKSPWTKHHCALHILVIVMILVDGFLVNLGYNFPPTNFSLESPPLLVYLFWARALWFPMSSHIIIASVVGSSVNF